MRRLLDGTIDEPVPPAPDLDTVIARARRSQQRRRLAVAVAVAVAVAGVSGGWVLAVDRGGPGPVAATDPLLRRFDEAIQAAVRAEAPAVVWQPVGSVQDPDESRPWSSGWFDAGVGSGGDGYRGRGGILVGELSGVLTVEIDHTPGAPRYEMVCPEPTPTSEVDCSMSSGPAGEQVIVEAIEPAGGPATPVEITVRAVRPDGRSLAIVATNHLDPPAVGPRSAATPLTAAQLRRVALAVAARLG
jgi:hypothetical protein